MTVVVVVALAVAALVVGRMIAASLAPQPSTATRLAALAGMTAQVSQAGWVQMDHDMSPDAPGYQMPPAMMPGMPTGDEQRLSVTVTMVNASDRTLPLLPFKEFALHAGENGKKWSPHSDTFGDLPRLAPHNAITGVLFFDLPPQDLVDSVQWLEWTHDGAAARLTVPLDGAAVQPSHPHNP